MQGTAAASKNALQFFRVTFSEEEADSVRAFNRQILSEGPKAVPDIPAESSGRVIQLDIHDGYADIVLLDESRLEIRTQIERDDYDKIDDQTDVRVAVNSITHKASVSRIGYEANGGSIRVVKAIRSE